MQKGVGYFYFQSMLTDESPVWLQMDSELSQHFTFRLGVSGDHKHSQTYRCQRRTGRFYRSETLQENLQWWGRVALKNELTNEHWDKKLLLHGCKPPISREQNESHRLQKDPKVVWMFNGRGCEFEVFLLRPSCSDAFSKKPLLHQIPSRQFIPWDGDCIGDLLFFLTSWDVGWMINWGVFLFVSCGLPCAMLHEMEKWFPMWCMPLLIIQYIHFVLDWQLLGNTSDQSQPLIDLLKSSMGICMTFISKWVWQLSSSSLPRFVCCIKPSRPPILLHRKVNDPVRNIQKVVYVSWISECRTFVRKIHQVKASKHPYGS